jgi:hypothetical protein
MGAQPRQCVARLRLPGRSLIRLQPGALERSRGISQPQAAKGMTMVLLTYYIALALAGSAVSAIIGLVVERTIPGFDLPVFFTLFTLVLWAAWKLAVYMTEPKVKKADDAGLAT